MEKIRDKKIGVATPAPCRGPALVSYLAPPPPGDAMRRVRPQFFWSSPSWHFQFELKAGLSRVWVYRHLANYRCATQNYNIFNSNTAMFLTPACVWTMQCRNSLLVMMRCSSYNWKIIFISYIFLYISHYHRLFEIIKFEEWPEKGTKLSFKHLWTVHIQMNICKWNLVIVFLLCFGLRFKL